MSLFKIVLDELVKLHEEKDKRTNASHVADNYLGISDGVTLGRYKKNGIPSFYNPTVAAKPDTLRDGIIQVVTKFQLEDIKNGIIQLHEDDEKKAKFKAKFEEAQKRFSKFMTDIDKKGVDTRLLLEKLKLKNLYKNYENITPGQIKIIVTNIVYAMQKDQQNKILKKQYLLYQNIDKKSERDKIISEVNIAEGETLDINKLENAVKNSELHGVDYEYSEFVEKYGNEFQIRAYNPVKTAYKEIFGAMPNVKFDHKNTKISYTDKDADIEGYITKTLGYSQDTFDEMYQKELDQAKERGYTYHPPKLWLNSFNRVEVARDSNNDVVYELELDFGRSDYIAHRVFERLLRENGTAKRHFEEIVSNMPNNKETFNKTVPHVWSRAGCGCWIVTSDDRLIISIRGSNVAEVPNRVSYSASGGVDLYYNEAEKELNTPTKNILKEIREELGIESIREKDLNLLSFGIDFSPWIQFSYIARCREEASEIKQIRTDKAPDSHEFKLAFIPYALSNIGHLLRTADMEAGAAWSLYRLYKLLDTRK